MRKICEHKEQSLPSRNAHPKLHKCSNVTGPFSEVVPKVSEGVLWDKEKISFKSSFKFKKGLTEISKLFKKWG